jgi:glycosyltransferase involved in cell wall biosynthesis
MEQRTRIALVTYAMHCGGMESFLLRLGGYLQQHGYEVELVTTLEPGEWFGRLAEVRVPAYHVPGYRRSGPLNPLQHTRRVSACLRQRNYNLIFLNHSRHAQAGLARLPDDVVAIPILHNDNEEIYQVGCGNPDAWNVAVAVSPKVASAARRREPSRPILEISSGVELPEAAQWQARRGWGAPLELIFIGRVDHGQKGVLWLPGIYQACLDRGVECRLTVVGDGPDAQQLRRQVSELGLLERTRFLQGLTHHQVYDLLLEAHILLMPSFYEGLPIALLESLACGCVPVVSRLPGITDHAVTDGETGLLVDVGDTAGFANAVATLHGSPDRWFRMSRAAHASAQSRFSVQAMGTSYLRLIEEALEGRYPLPRSRKVQRAFEPALFSWRDFLPDLLRRYGRRGRLWWRTESPWASTFRA